MKNQQKRLRIIALAVPGLLVLSNSTRGWTPHTTTDGTGYHADAQPSTGYTFAQYDRSGFNISGHKLVHGINRATGDEYPVNANFSGQSLVTVTGFWSENTYSFGECQITDFFSGNEAHGWLTSP